MTSPWEEREEGSHLERATLREVFEMKLCWEKANSWLMSFCLNSCLWQKRSLLFLSKRGKFWKWLSINRNCLSYVCKLSKARFPAVFPLSQRVCKCVFRKSKLRQGQVFVNYELMLFSLKDHSTLQTPQLQSVCLAGVLSHEAQSEPWDMENSFEP